MRPALPYDYTFFADSNTFEYEIFKIGYCIYAVIVHQTNISYTNGVAVCKACIIIW